MDNLTHGLCGALVAELWLQLAPKRLRVDAHTPKQRRWTYIASIAANNLPDADLLLTPLVEGKLGYLLHHRGHTHTVVGALGLAALLIGLLALVLGRGRRDVASDSAPSTRQLLVGPACVSVVGVLLHLLLDYGNNYGVHPFWPIDDRWFFGDAVFIIEPWWWSVAGACLAGTALTSRARYGLWTVWLLGTFAAWFFPLPTAARGYALLIGVAAALTLGVHWPRLPLDGARRIVAGCSAICVLYALQIGLRTRALDRVHAALERPAVVPAAPATPNADPEVRVLELIATPSPATPWCWDVIVVGTQRAEREREYVLSIARVSSLPDAFAAEDCPVSRPNPSAPLRAAATRAAAAGVIWEGEYHLGAQDWQSLGRDCTVQAFLRYARAPFVATSVVAGATILGDLRYDRLPEVEFAEILVPEPGSPCPKWVPAWQPPRQDLTDALGQSAH